MATEYRSVGGRKSLTLTFSFTNDIKNQGINMEVIPFKCFNSANISRQFSDFLLRKSRNSYKGEYSFKQYCYKTREILENDVLFGLKPEVS